MKVWIRIAILLFISFSLFAQNNGQPTFRAHSNLKIVELGTTVSVHFTAINGEMTNFTPPDFAAFQVMGSPSQSSSIISVNGKVSKQFEITYTLRPKKIGSYTLKGATAKIGNRIMKTNSVRFQVVKATNMNATTQKELDKLKEGEVFIRLEVNTKEAYLGQQILVDYKLYTRKNVNGISQKTEDDFEGFFSYDLDVRRFPTKEERVNGKMYKTKVIKRVALFSQQTGSFTLKPIQFQVNLLLGESTKQQRRSFFFRPPTEAHYTTTNEMVIQVRNTPKPIPDGFNGAVGNFKIFTSVNRENLTTDDAITVSMQIHGNGASKQYRPSPLYLSDSLEVYDPKIIEESENEIGGQIQQVKNVEYIVLPKYPGNYSITPSMTYFDTDSLKYIELKPKTFHFQVKQGKGSRQIIPQNNPKGGLDMMTFLPCDTAIHHPIQFYGSPVFFRLFTLPFLFLGYFFNQKRKEDAWNRIGAKDKKRRLANSVASKKLAAAKTYKTTGNTRAFYEEISNALQVYICNKIDFPFADLKKDQLKKAMVNHNIQPELIDTFFAILNTCQVAIYAGGDKSKEMDRIFDESSKWIDQMENKIS